MLDEVTLRFVRTVERLCDKCSKPNMTVNLSNVSREQLDELYEQRQDGRDCAIFNQGVSRAEEICHRILRQSRGSFARPVSTFEERAVEADRLVPYALKSKKEDAEFEKARPEEAIIYLQESITKESREKAESGAEGHFYGSGFFVKVRSSEYRYELVQFRNWDTYEAETKDKITILTAWRDFLNEVITMYERKLKERDNAEAVKLILKEAKELTSEHKRYRQKIQKILEKPNNPPNGKDVKTFMEGREAMSIIEGKLHTLEKKFDNYQTSPETEFPSLVNELTSDRISGNCYGNETRSAVVKEFEKLYREIKDKEASKKA